MNEFTKQSRRKFLLTAGASALGSVFLKGCLGNPPGTTGSGSTNQVQPVAATNTNPAQAPETPRIKLGYIPIVEAAPLIVAQEKGFFAKYGMTEVEISKQANWGAARDNVEIGSAGGGIDGGQWQMPMPYLISEGRITKGNVRIPMYVLCQLNTQGNGIAIANLVRLALLTEDLSYLDRAEQALQAFSSIMHAAPQASPSLFTALDWYRNCTKVCTSSELLASLQTQYLPACVFTLATVPPTAVGLVCQGLSCLAPASTSEQLQQQLQQSQNRDE